MSSLSTISLYILLALVALLTVFLGIFHLWSMFLTTKDVITDVRKQWLGLSSLERRKSLLKYLLVLVAPVIFFWCFYGCAGTILSNSLIVYFFLDYLADNITQ